MTNPGATPLLTASLTGVSGFGEVHYHDLLRQVERGQIRLAAAAVVNQDQEREKCAKLAGLGCRLFDSHQAMLDEFRGKIDLAFIPTGIPLHAPFTIAALKAGANVFVEKPAAATVQDVAAMKAAVRETGRFVAVGYQTMYAREALWMKKKILDGAIGRVLAIKSHCLWPRLDAYYTRNGWAGRLKQGADWVLDSPYNNAVSHQLNMICFLAGTSPSRSADLASIQAELYRAHDIESADTACIRILTATGVPLYFVVSHASEGTQDPEIEVRGEKGTIRWEFDKAATLSQADGVREVYPAETWDPLRDSMMARLRARVSDPGVFVCSLDIAGQQTLCVNGAHDSSDVRVVPASFLRRSPSEESVKTVIEGIDQAVRAAIAAETLFSEMGLPWARPGKVIDLSGYEYFPGGKKP